MKNNRGEVTIMMVITVIVLIILGGVCIFMLTGEDGIFVPRRDVVENDNTVNNKDQVETNNNTENNNENTENNVVNDETANDTENTTDNENGALTVPME